MIDTPISFEESGFYSQIVLDYLRGVDNLKRYYKFPYQLDSLDAASQQKHFPDEKRVLLCNVIAEQYQRVGIDISQHDALHENTTALRETNTFTVTTGHQISLATGPMYFIIKIIHTIKLANELSQQYPDKKVLPVFWMATEDHDFEEIKSIRIGMHKMSWDIDSNEAPVGRLSTHAIQAFFKEFELGIEYNQIIQQWQSIYENANNLADATLKLVHELFGEYGLIVIDADNHYLKSSFQQIIKEDVLHQSVFTALNQTNQELGRTYHLQVNGRGINHFYIHDGARKLIDFENQIFTIKGTDKKFSIAEMEIEITTFPERFSPNVVLRPVYQEYILPNLAYIGGPGELAYWLQLKRVFDKLEVDYPVLICRNSYVFLNTLSARNLKKLKLQPKDLFIRKDVLIKKLVHQLAPTSHDTLLQQVSALYQQLIDEVAPIDNRLTASIIEGKKNIEKELSSLINQILKAKKKKHDASILIVNELLEAVLPDGAPAERVFNILHFTNQPKQLIAALYSYSESIPQSVKVIIL